jgi:hypothetical protein
MKDHDCRDFGSQLGTTRDTGEPDCDACAANLLEV